MWEFKIKIMRTEIKWKSENIQCGVSVQVIRPADDARRTMGHFRPC